MSDMSRVLQDPKAVSTLCRIPAFLCFNLRLDAVQEDLEELLDMNLAAAILAQFRKPMPLQIQSPQMSVKSLDHRSRLLVSCYRALVQIVGGNARFAEVARILPHFPEPDIVFGNIGGNPVSVPEYITDPTILRPKRAPTGDWWVLIMSNRKSISINKKVIGIDGVKVRQLEALGFKPIVVPFTSIDSSTSAVQEIAKLLKIRDIHLPNVDNWSTDILRKL